MFLIGLLFGVNVLAQDPYTLYGERSNALYQQQVDLHSRTTQQTAALWSQYVNQLNTANQNRQDSRIYNQSLDQARQLAVQYFQTWRSYYGWVLGQMDGLRQQFAAYPDLVAAIDQWRSGVYANQQTALSAEAQNYANLGISQGAEYQQQPPSQGNQQQPGDPKLERITDCVDEVVLLGQHHACVE